MHITESIFSDFQINSINATAFSKVHKVVFSTYCPFFLLYNCKAVVKMQ